MDLDAAYGCIAAYAGRLADLQSLSSLSMWMQHMEASQHMDALKHMDMNAAYGCISAYGYGCSIVMHCSIWIWMQHMDAAYGSSAAYAGRLADLQSLSSLSIWMQHMEASQHMLRGLRTYRGYV
jgi:hypothetical protein